MKVCKQNAGSNKKKEWEAVHCSDSEQNQVCLVFVWLRNTPQVLHCRHELSKIQLKNQRTVGDP